ncbi:MAG: DUF2132 domain-containing protein [Ignavibacteria bacterium]|nr:DUF2132 domain-containing protein [Ignavibacteria bacterium]
MQEQKDPLHGKTLQMILEHLVNYYGWKELGTKINIKCFQENPTITSSLRFLRKTSWARAKVESLYLYSLRKIEWANEKKRERSEEEDVDMGNEISSLVLHKNEFDESDNTQ